MENKTEDFKSPLKTPGPKPVKRFMAKMALGLILVVAGLIMVFAWWHDLWVVVRGCVGVLVVLSGAVALAMARE
jgi:hypothetical protein